MAPAAAEIAERLVAFDERLARDLLGRICADLGGPAAEEAEPDVEEMRSFLASAEVGHRGPLSRLGDVDDSPASTAEWKTEFAHFERMRALGLELSQRLR
ncbi:MAG: hypothetical protein KY396_07950 [Actinobacteria bacterium]|nr:hypothetical protein [Actinomycetota bacterium]